MSTKISLLELCQKSSSEILAYAKTHLSEEQMRDSASHWAKVKNDAELTLMAIRVVANTIKYKFGVGDVVTDGAAECLITGMGHHYPVGRRKKKNGEYEANSRNLYNSRSFTVVSRPNEH